MACPEENTGRIGIGTTTPVAKLEVNGNGGYDPGTFFSYFTRGTTAPNTGNAGSGTAVPYSIVASDRILAVEFNAVSDARIKNIRGRLSTTAALENVMALKPTHYNYIDSIAEGSTRKTGFIAQEVKAVVPEAVTATQKRFIPDVYKLAESVNYDAETALLHVTLPATHDLVAGDSVRFITKAGDATALVAQIDANNAVVFNNFAGPIDAAELESVFVFGKWVTDFHTVDYDHLYTMGIGAIQALQQQLSALKSECDVKLKAQAEATTELKYRVERLETLMDQQTQR